MENNNRTCIMQEILDDLRDNMIFEKADKVSAFSECALELSLDTFDSEKVDQEHTNV